MYQYRREPLDTAEIDLLANACQTLREKFVVWTLLDTGVRVSELAALTRQQVQWQERRIVVFGKGGPYGSRSKRRVVPMSDRVRSVMEALLAFQDDTGISPRTIQRIVKNVAGRSGITKTVTPHILRHTFAVQCIQKGISTRALQQFLGHDRLQTTEIYLNLSPEAAIEEWRRKW